MKTRYNDKKANPSQWLFLILALVWLTGLVSCNKTEFMPADIGEVVAYEPSVSTPIEEVLLESGHTLFHQAWQASTIQTILIFNGYPETGFTLMAPSDKALRTKGWTADAIASAKQADLDTLLLEHIFIGTIPSQDLLERPDHYAAKNLLEYRDYYYFEGGQRPGGGVTHITGTEVVPYRYRAYLAWDGHELYSNGKKIGNSSPVEALNAIIWPIDEVMERPRKTALQTLREDPRFRLYVQLLEYTEQLKFDRMKEILSSSTNNAWRNLATDEMIDVESKLFRASFNLYGLQHLQIHPYSEMLMGYDKPIINTLNTWFIPTNEAFAREGFHTLQDFVDFNQHNPPMEGGPSWLNTSNSSNPSQVNWKLIFTKELATDTLLDYHQNWARRWAPVSGSLRLLGQPNISVFYSTDLLKPYVKDYQLNGILLHVTYGVTRQRLFHYMPLEFSGGAGQIQVKAKESSSVPANIIEADIQTLNGPIHAVDRLLTPPDFQF